MSLYDSWRAEAGEHPEYGLAEYRAWTGATIDPRRISIEACSAALCAVVRVETPVSAARAYRACCGLAGRELPSAIKARLNLAANEALTAGHVFVNGPMAHRRLWFTLLTPESPPVLVRRRGLRRLDEIPHDEIGELMRRVTTAHGRLSEGELFQTVLSAYGLAVHSEEVLRLLRRCNKLSK